MCPLRGQSLRGALQVKASVRRISRDADAVTAAVLQESGGSLQFRRSVRFAAGIVVVVGLGLGASRVSISEPAIGFVVAYGLLLLSLVLYLNVSRELSVQEKTVWRGKLWWSSGVVLALVTFLSSRDIHASTEDLARSESKAQ